MPNAQTASSTATVMATRATGRASRGAHDREGQQPESTATISECIEAIVDARIDIVATITWRSETGESQRTTGSHGRSACSKINGSTMATKTDTAGSSEQPEMCAPDYQRNAILGGPVGEALGWQSVAVTSGPSASVPMSGRRVAAR
jgi:hypothetical protein